MEGNRRPFFKKHSIPQFKKKGERGSNKKGKWLNSSREQSFGNSHSSDTVYRILCQSRKIGSVIGKGGERVKALREETQAKITVAESVPGCDERVIKIYSPSVQIPRKHDTDNIDEDPATDKEDGLMEPHCASQDALLKVHDRIIEEDLLGQTENGDDTEIVVTARLLVPNNMVGCLLGKKGDVIQRLRSETGASIRVLPAEHLPTCAMNSDELVQISGKPAVTKQALYEVSTLLHQNPRKDNPPSNFPMAHRGQGFHPPMGSRLPPGNPMWSEWNTNPHGMPPRPWMGEYGNQPSEFGPGGFDGPPAAHGGEAPSEFSMKILCSAAKIGGVIGKGGANVKQLERETGARIDVEDVSGESDDRIIRISSIEAPWNPRSQTVEAILQLQNKTSELTDKGIITTRLLVPSSKVGCILGQGGHVINDMRRRTRADIRVYSNEDKPKCASKDEELVQISGNFGVAEDALAEIASRLRMRCLRGANAGAEPAPIGPVPRFGPSGNLPSAGPPHSGPVRPGSSGRYEVLKGGQRAYEPPSYPVPPSATRFQHVNNSMDARTANNPVNSFMGTGWNNFGEGGGRENELPRYPVPPRATGFQNAKSSIDARIPNNALNPVLRTGDNHIGEISGTRMTPQDHQSWGSERAVEIRGSSEHLNATQNIPQHYNYEYSNASQNIPQDYSYEYSNAAQNIPQAYSNTGGQNNNPPQGSYQNYDAQRGNYLNINAHPETQYQLNPQQAPYQNLNTQQAAYQNNSAAAQGSYQY